MIAPDYPAFGQSAVPSRSEFHYTHAHLSEVVEALILKLGVTRFAMYVMDFGGPIGYRLMVKYPDRVTGVVVQNAPAFGEPTNGPLWETLAAYWKDGSSAHRDAVRSGFTPDAVRNQYLVGTREPSLIDPDNWTIDSALLAFGLSVTSTLAAGVGLIHADDACAAFTWDVRHERALFGRDSQPTTAGQAVSGSPTIATDWL